MDTLVTQVMGELRSWPPQIFSDSYYDPKKEKDNNHKNNLLIWSQDMCTLVIYLLCYLSLSLTDDLSPSDKTEPR